MGNLNNCFTCNNFENNTDSKFQTNLLNFISQQKNDKNNSELFNNKKNSEIDIEKKLKEIKQKYAIKKIIKQFKQFKLKNQISPIRKVKDEALVINSSNFSNFLLSSLKMKKVSKFYSKKRSITKALSIKEKNNKELYISEFDINTSTSSVSKRDNFQNLFQKVLIKYYLGEDDFYIGEFYKNDFSGYGYFISNKAIIYEGDWKKNIQSGYGLEFWGSGSIFKGEFNNGSKEGIGIYIWPDKSKYEGEWCDNCFNGYGIYYYRDNKIYLGQWEMNEKSGFGIYLTNDTIYIGNYKDDKKNGFGIFYWRKKNEAYVGFFKNGNQSGFGKFLFDNRNSKYGIWNNSNNNTIKWYKNIKNENKFLEKKGIDYYKNFFLFNLEEIINFSNSIIKDDNLIGNLNYK